jgi:hypothetical protein
MTRQARASVIGNLLGAGPRRPAVDSDLLAQLEGGDVITQVAGDLHDVFADGQPPDSQRYPAEKGERDHAQPALTIAVKHSVRAGCRAAAGSGAGDARSLRPTG